MKKPTKSKPHRQLRSPRSSRQRRPSPAAKFLDLRQQIQGRLLEAIPVAATAHQLVEDEVGLLVGEPWSREGDSLPCGATATPGRPCCSMESHTYT